MLVHTIQKLLFKPQAEHVKMLVISRKANESLVIGDSIVVTVVEIRADKVRLGIEAPCEVSVHRAEIAAALGLIPPGSAAAEISCRALEREIAELTAQLQQHPEPASELRTRLEEKRIELAAMRRGRPPQS